MTKSMLERFGDVHVLTLNDPAKRNAIDLQLAEELVDHARALSNARALVIRGEGSAFSAGADLHDIFGEERCTADMRAMLVAYYQSFLSIRALPVPTFAAVHGPAIGAGLNLALACDIRIATPAASFGATFSRIGLHPGGGCTWFLVEALGRQEAFRVLIEGQVIDAQQALDHRLVSAIHNDAFEAALGIAERAAALEPELARSIKRSVDLAGDRGSLETVVEIEAWAQAESTHSRRFREWIARFE